MIRRSLRKRRSFWRRGIYKRRKHCCSQIRRLDPPFLRAVCALFQRRYADSHRNTLKSACLPRPTATARNIEKLLLGLSQQRAGDVAAARATYQSAVQDIQRGLEKVAPGSFQEAGLYARFGLGPCRVGRSDLCYRRRTKSYSYIFHVQRSSRGPRRRGEMAKIYALLGDADHAIPILKRLLQIPYGRPAITPALLRLDPVWDQIRNDPRFQELASEK